MHRKFYPLNVLLLRENKLTASFLSQRRQANCEVGTVRLGACGFFVCYDFAGVFFTGRLLLTEEVGLV